jgi:hypothetical protein
MFSATGVSLWIVREGEGASLVWLPGMDSNHDKQNQNLLCYHYTTRQKGKISESYDHSLVKNAVCENVFCGRYGKCRSDALQTCPVLP